MTPTTSIPRFLLPQISAIWRSRSSRLGNSSSVRNASHNAPKKPSKPLILEKPAKFNPPSHGAKLRKSPPRYPGPQLSAEEAAVQRTKKYPNMMPAEGTFLHWFLTNRSIHLYITLGTLFTLASTVFITNFKQNSPFADMLPHWSQLFTSPIAATRTMVEVLKLDSERRTAETMERRTRKVEDVHKRAAYRKAHGLDKDEGFGGWTAKSNEESLGPAIAVGNIDVAAATEDENKTEDRPVREKKHVKKWLGIW